MRPSSALNTHRDLVLKLAIKHGVQNVRVFGSVLHGADIDGSDLDLLVDAPKGTTLLDMIGLQQDIEHELGIPVDVLTTQDLPESFRKQVLREAHSL